MAYSSPPDMRAIMPDHDDLILCVENLQYTFDPFDNRRFATQKANANRHYKLVAKEYSGARKIDPNSTWALKRLRKIRDRELKQRAQTISDNMVNDTQEVGDFRAAFCETLGMFFRSSLREIWISTRVILLGKTNRSKSKASSKHGGTGF